MYIYVYIKLSEYKITTNLVIDLIGFYLQFFNGAASIQRNSMKDPPGNGGTVGFERWEQ